VHCPKGKNGSKDPVPPNGADGPVARGAHILSDDVGGVRFGRAAFFQPSQLRAPAGEVAMKPTLLLAALLVVGLAACEDRANSGYGSGGTGTTATTPQPQPGVDPSKPQPEDNPAYTYRPGRHN
jgi:hypothetical protein